MADTKETKEAAAKKEISKDKLKALQLTLDKIEKDFE